MTAIARPTLALLLWLSCYPAQAQFGPDHVILFPSVITPTTPIQASVPVNACWHGDPTSSIASSSTQVTGNVVSLIVNTISFLCFSAGDPVVKKAVWFPLPTLPEGVYTLAYELRAPGTNPIAYQESVKFAVVSAPPTNFTGLWWKSPAGSESGWGLSIDHQGDILFCVWYTYRADGSAAWLVMSDAEKTNDGIYSGTLYRTTGPQFDSVPWNPSVVAIAPVGSGALAFSDANNGTFSYTVNGVTQTKPITRQVFWAPTN